MMIAFVTFITRLKTIFCRLAFFFAGTPERTPGRQDARQDGRTPVKAIQKAHRSS
jgi:hypothetical protein